MGSGDTVVGVIDVGSNTIHLAVVAMSEQGRLRYLADETALVRLGEDVSASGRISPERMNRAIATLAAQVRQARECQAGTVLGIATEGVRAAGNGDELIERAERECELVLRLVSGAQEAQASPDHRQLLLRRWGILRLACAYLVLLEQRFQARERWFYQGLGAGIGRLGRRKEGFQQT